MHQGREAFEDGTTVRRVLAGDRQAFVVLLRRHYADVLDLCRRVLGSKVEAEDVAQEAALQALLNLGRLREPERFAAWFHSIAANLAYGSLRRRRPMSLDPFAERTLLVDTSPTPEQVRAARELHDAVLSALNGLSNVNREAVIGYYLEGQSYVELSELLGVPVSTVKGRLHKSRRQLRPALDSVAREVFGVKRRGKEKMTETHEAVQVTVDEVIRIASGDVGWREFAEVARSMSVPEDPTTTEKPSVQAVLMMREVGGERVLPIYVGMNEAFSIWLSTTGGRSMRPLTHDLMHQILDTVDLQVKNVTVNRLAERTFYAEISMTQGERTYEVDSRPSDAIALAVRLNAPIFAARPVFDEATLPSKQAWPDWHREQFGTYPESERNEP